MTGLARLCGGELGMERWVNPRCDRGDLQFGLGIGTWASAAGDYREVWCGLCHVFLRQDSICDQDIV